MTLPAWVKTLRPDPFVLILLGVVALASLLPARGEAAVTLAWTTKIVIGLVFFMHGAKLSTQALVDGMLHWRLHLTVLAITFAAFPLLSLGITAAHLLPSQLALGFVFLCCLPSTVQSSIAFTAIARGDVAAAVTSASVSNLLGMVLTPLLVGLFTHAQGAAPMAALVQGVLLQLLGPFLLGQILRRWVGGWVTRHKGVLSKLDRGSVLLVVYAAFGAAVTGGVWRRVGPLDLLLCGLVAAALLAAALTIAVTAARRMGLSKASEIAVVFCGSKKSLVTGAPMAGILFPPAVAGVVIIPVMIYHQLQLIVCAVIAQRYGQRTDGLEATVG
jgi:solute carrier family 10 (sodium/bile acid cotransporter), member 7